MDTRIRALCAMVANIEYWTRSAAECSSSPCSRDIYLGLELPAIDETLEPLRIR
jgi:hypothetical protein